MYYINKVVGFVASPLGVAFLGALATWGLWRVGWRRTARVCAWMLGAVMWFCSTPLAVRLIGVPLEEGVECEQAMAKRCGDISGLPQADAICVLGGGMGCHEKCGAAEMFSGADRVWQGARLYKRHLAPQVICTSDHVEESTVPLLLDLGVPREAIVCLEGPRNTEEEARRIKGSGVGRVLLVTSAWHMKRARMLFERAGLEVVPAPTDYEMAYTAEAPVEAKDFVPNADSLMKVSSAIKEWVGRLGYAVLK